MSDEESPSDKEHDPTQKRLDDAREKGELPRSADLFTAAGYAGLLLASLGLGAQALMKTGEAAAVMLGQADSLAPLFFAGSHPVAGGFLVAMMSPLLPLFLTPAVAVLLCVFAQRAMVFAPSKLAPKLNRISPLSGLQNKLGRRGLFEFVKSFVKLTIIATLLGVFFGFRAAEILETLYMTPAMATAVLMRELVAFLLLVLLIAVVIGGVDYFWQYFEHLRSNRMSRKDLVDEQKSAEGDPHMKAKRRQKGYDIATNQMLRDVATADVVIVNPTHFAIALKWDRASGRAPVCVAKGVDEIAARIREKAAEAGIPLHSDPPTARALHAGLEIGQEIHPDHYRAVAAAIRFAEKMRRTADKLRGSRP